MEKEREYFNIYGFEVGCDVDYNGNASAFRAVRKDGKGGTLYLYRKTETGLELVYDVEILKLSTVKSGIYKGRYEFS